jgi:hypothetical protein
MLFDRGHIRHWILFGTLLAFRVKKNAAATSCTLNKSTMTHRTRKDWYKRFREGDFDLKDKECPGQPEEFEDRAKL